MSGLTPTFLLLQIFFSTMALDLDQIRTAAERVAASHSLDVVEVEYQGGSKHRILRVFIEKNAAARAKLAEDVKTGGIEAGFPSGVEPSGVEIDRLAGVTHDDCQVFSHDFGTLLDVEELIPGAEYSLEVSSPGLDRKLYGEADYRRFTGSLVKLQTFEPVAGNRHWQGRLTEVKGNALVLDLSAVRQKGKGKKNLASETAEIEFANIEKANLVPEI